MAIPEIITNTSAGAPSLTGQVGSLKSVLDYALVDGYTGVTPCGWERQYEDNEMHKAIYRSSNLSSTRFVVRLFDNNGRWGQIRGAEVANDIDTLVRPVPTTTQISGEGMTVQKSITNDSTARKWVIIGTDTFVTLLIECNTSADGYQLYYFGDFDSYLPGDTYNFTVGAFDTNADSIYLGYGPERKDSNAGCYIARNEAGDIGPVKPLLGFPIGVSGGAAAIGFGPLSVPDSITGKVPVLMPVYISNSTKTGVRGRLFGIWDHAHNNSSMYAYTSLGSEIDNLDNLPGKTFANYRLYTLAGNTRIFIETSDWATL